MSATDLDSTSESNISCGKPVHTNIEDELYLPTKETNLTPETGIDTEQSPEELHHVVRKSKSVPYERTAFWNNKKKQKTSRCTVLHYYYWKQNR